MTLTPGPIVMGVLDLSLENLQIHKQQSFIEQALQKAEQMLSAGAAIIDVSSAELNERNVGLSVQDELELVVPVIEVLTNRISIPISINTGNPTVMSAAVSAGAKIINDVHALTKVSALATAAQLKQYVCLMHMYNDPVTKQIQPAEHDIVSTVYNYLEQRIAACVAEGIDRGKIIIDPGFGFGKNLPQNISLLRSLHIFKNLNCPILVDVAHKSMLGQILDVDYEDRLYGSVAAEIIAISRGADIIRSHDVRATVDAVKVFKAIAAD